MILLRITLSNYVDMVTRNDGFDGRNVADYRARRLEGQPQEPFSLQLKRPSARKTASRS
jgi:hypothetical protein